MHSLMLLAVLLDFILPLSGLLYDNLYAKSEPGWHGRGFAGFWFWAGTDFYVAILSAHDTSFSIASPLAERYHRYIEHM